MQQKTAGNVGGFFSVNEKNAIVCIESVLVLLIIW